MWRCCVRLRAWPHVASAFPFGEVVHVSDARAGMDAATTRAALQEHLGRAGIADVSIERIEPGIEDTFMELMGTRGETVAA